MGAAAYNRGSRVISAQFCRDRRCLGCSCCSEHTPTPRPSDWGSGVRAKAEAKGRTIIRGAALMGRPSPSLADLADMIQMDTKWSRKACEDGAARALAA